MKSKAKFGNLSEEFSEVVLEFALAGAAAAGYSGAERGDAAEPAVTIAPHAEVLSIAILAVYLKGRNISMRTLQADSTEKNSKINK